MHHLPAYYKRLGPHKGCGRFIVGLQFNAWWIQIGVYAPESCIAGDIALSEYDNRIERLTPAITSIVQVDKDGNSINRFYPV